MPLIRGGWGKFNFFFKDIEFSDFLRIAFGLLVVALLEAFSLNIFVPFSRVLFSSDTGPIFGASSILAPFNFLQKWGPIGIGGLVLGLILSKNLGVFLIKRHQVRVSFGTQVVLSNRLFNHLIRHDYIYFLGKNSPELIRIVSSVSNSIVQGFIFPVFNLVSDSIVLLVVVGFLLVSEPVLGAIVGTLIASLLAFLTFKFRKRLKIEGELRNQNAQKYSQLLNDVFHGMRDMKIAGREAEVSSEFLKFSGCLADTEKTLATLSLVPSAINEVLTFLAFILTISIAWWLDNGRGEYLVNSSIFMFSMYRIIPTASRLIPIIQTIAFYEHATEIVYHELKGIPNLAKEWIKFSASDVAFRSDFKLENVSFKYPGSESLILNRVNLEIRKGRITGIIGESGAGKSTLLDVMFGLLPPDSGTISLDGNALNPEALTKFRCSIAYVSQNVFLANQSIEENVVFSKDECVDRSLLRKSLSVTESLEFVNNLPEREKTAIGERGMNLSGGQRQRIGIARAIYLRKPILVLDEATSALDLRTEEMVLSNLRKEFPELTIVIVSHRPEVRAICDSVYLLHENQLTEIRDTDAAALKELK